MAAGVSRPSTDGIYLVMRERICLLDLEPGSRLTEEALAAEFGVSRTPIRQVLERLQHQGLVQQRPGSGASVAIIDTKAMRDVWAVRLKMAELIGDFVRLPAPAPVLDRLERIATDTETVRTTRDVRALGALYNAYHDTLLSVLANDTLREILDRLYHQTARVWLQFLPEMDLDAEIDMMIDEIRQTREALVQRTGAQLTKVRSTHMQMLLSRFNEHVARPLG